MRGAPQMTGADVKTQLHAPHQSEVLKINRSSDGKRATWSLTLSTTRAASLNTGGSRVVWRVRSAQRPHAAPIRHRKSYDPQTNQGVVGGNQSSSSRSPRRSMCSTTTITRIRSIVWIARHAYRLFHANLDHAGTFGGGYIGVLASRCGPIYILSLDWSGAEMGWLVINSRGQSENHSLDNCMARRDERSLQLFLHPASDGISPRRRDGRSSHDVASHRQRAQNVGLLTPTAPRRSPMRRDRANQANRRGVASWGCRAVSRPHNTVRRHHGDGSGPVCSINRSYSESLARLQPVRHGFERLSGG